MLLWKCLLVSWFYSFGVNPNCWPLALLKSAHVSKHPLSISDRPNDVYSLSACHVRIPKYLRKYCELFLEILWTSAYPTQMRNQRHIKETRLQKPSLVNKLVVGVTFKSMGNSKAAVLLKIPHRMGDDSQNLYPWSSLYSLEAVLQVRKLLFRGSYFFVYNGRERLPETRLFQKLSETC